MPETRILFIYSNVNPHYYLLFLFFFSFRSIHASSSSSFCSKSNQVCAVWGTARSSCEGYFFECHRSALSSVVKWLPTAAKRSQPADEPTHITSFCAAKIPCSDSYRHIQSLGSYSTHVFHPRNLFHPSSCFLGSAVKSTILILGVERVIRIMQKPGAAAAGWHLSISLHLKFILLLP